MLTFVSVQTVAGVQDVKLKRVLVFTAHRYISDGVYGHSILAPNLLNLLPETRVYMVNADISAACQHSEEGLTSHHRAKKPRT